MTTRFDRAKQWKNGFQEAHDRLSEIMECWSVLGPKLDARDVAALSYLLVETDRKNPPPPTPSFKKDRLKEIAEHRLLQLAPGAKAFWEDAHPDLVIESANTKERYFITWEEIQDELFLQTLYKIIAFLNETQSTLQ